ncbi:hypothetical protein [Pseudoduganella rivuli]|uniref:hypothetical protein n=1 Tax=Pseudoduganella rivuli TaxID=2666085 RepID=UPI0018A1CDBE|nr:hypothetical protein [Pseudoduganella rivuli]
MSFWLSRSGTAEGLGNIVTIKFMGAQGKARPIVAKPERNVSPMRHLKNEI